MNPIVEICCGSYEDAMNAFYGGAKRIELNSALFLGGLTPSIGSLKKIKEETDLEVICMVRPRGAGFCYSERDFEVMIEDCILLLENGADGIAFGILNSDGTIDYDRNKKLISIIHHYNKTAVFHRAIDVVNDIDKAMTVLIELKVDRILTSGKQIKAIDGIDVIKHLQDNYGHLIEILAGSGVNSKNANYILDKTGINQIHSSCKSWCNDYTTTMSTVKFDYHDNQYEIVDCNLVKELIKTVKSG